MEDNKQHIRGIVVKQSKKDKLSFTVRYSDDSWKDKETGKRVYNHKYVNVFVREPYASVVEKNIAPKRHVTVIGKSSVGAYIDKEGNPRGVLNMNDPTVIFLDNRPENIDETEDNDSFNSAPF